MNGKEKIVIYVKSVGKCACVVHSSLLPKKTVSRSGHDLLSLLASFGLSAGRTSRDSISCQLFALISPIFNLSFTQSPYFLGFLVDVSQPQKLYLQNVTFSCQSSFLNAFT